MLIYRVKELERIPGICREVEYVFTITNLVYVWPQLDRVIHRSESQRIMKALWSQYDSMTDPKISPGRFILLYTQQHLNPLLNNKLGRPIDFPTWNNLLAFALRDIISNDSGCWKFKEHRVNEDPRFKFYPGMIPSERLKEKGHFI